MAIPTNLLTINNPFNQELDQLGNLVTPQIEIPKPAIPTNLLPVNASDISSSLQSLVGQIPTIDSVEIPQFSLLNVVIPDSLFKTGSLDQIKERTLGTATRYINGLQLPKLIPSIPNITLPLPAFPPKRPSYAQIKNYIKTKIDRIKKQRQKASIKALNNELKMQENPFKYRQMLQNQQIQNRASQQIQNRVG